MMPLCTVPRREAQIEPREGIGCPRLFEYEIDGVLCHRLEAIADRLPDPPNARELRQVGELLLAARDRWLDPVGMSVLAAVPSLSRARFSDGLHAEDLLEALCRYWRDPDPARSGELAYMLRTLFDGRRRSVELERSHFGCVDCPYSESA